MSREMSKEMSKALEIAVYIEWGGDTCLLNSFLFESYETKIGEGGGARIWILIWIPVPANSPEHPAS
jgi:hypothetical protein